MLRLHVRLSADDVKYITGRVLHLERRFGLPMALEEKEALMRRTLVDHARDVAGKCGFAPEVVTVNTLAFAHDNKSAALTLDATVH
jgi:hypothetical protein